MSHQKSPLREFEEQLQDEEFEEIVSVLKRWRKNPKRKFLPILLLPNLLMTIDTMVDEVIKRTQLGLYILMRWKDLADIDEESIVDMLKKYLK